MEDSDGNSLIKSLRGCSDDFEQSLNDSAQELLEAISNSESVAPSNSKSGTNKNDYQNSFEAFTEDFLPSSKLVTERGSKQSKQVIKDDVVLNIKLDSKITIHDMPKSQWSPERGMKIITHKLKFVNIQNSEEFLTSDSETRKKMLYNYHMQISPLQAYLIRTLLGPTVREAIQAPSDNEEDAEPVISSLQNEELQLSSDPLYITTFGRKTKRKVYNDEDFPDFDPKRAKGDEDDDEWASTSGAKVNFNNNTIEKHSSKSSAKAKQNDSPDSSQSFALSQDFDQLDELLRDIETVKKKQKKHTNSEITSGGTNTPKKGRIEAIMEASREENEKKRQQEEEEAVFVNSLDSSAQVDSDFDNFIIDDEEMLEKRIVQPPSRRRPIHGRKRGAEPLKVSVKPSNVPFKRSNSRTEKGTSSNSNFTLTRGKKAAVATAVCPLCSKSFPQTEIEEHASTCGEDLAFPQQVEPQRITCEICDEVVPFSTIYEVHVRECARRNSKK